MPELNLRSELEALNEREAEEAKRRESGREGVVAELQKAEGEVADLTDKLARARHSVSKLSEQLEAIGPSEGSNTSQYMQDRLGVIGRVLSVDRHSVDTMIEAFEGFSSRMTDIGEEQSADPSIERDRELVDEMDRDETMLDSLPEAVRAVVAERAQEARERLDRLAIPERPSLSARTYVAEGPTIDGGHAYLVVLPVNVTASNADDPHALFLVNAIAAACQAIAHRPDAGVPDLVALPGREHGLLLSIRDADVPEEDHAYFAIRFEDELSRESGMFLAEAESIDDPLLKHALAGITGDFEFAGGTSW